MCLIRRTRAVGKFLKVALESTALRNQLVPLEKPIGYCEEQLCNGEKQSVEMTT